MNTEHCRSAVIPPCEDSREGEALGTLRNEKRLFAFLASRMADKLHVIGPVRSSCRFNYRRATRGREMQGNSKAT